MVIWIEAISRSRYIEFLVTVIVVSYIRVYYLVLLLGIMKVTMSENLSSILLNKTNHHLAWPVSPKAIEEDRKKLSTYVYASAFLLLFLFLFLGCM